MGGNGSDLIDAGAGIYDIVRFSHSGGEAILAAIGAVGGERCYESPTVASATQGTDTVVNFAQIDGSLYNGTFNITDAATHYAAAFIFAGSGNAAIISNISTGSGFSVFLLTIMQHAQMLASRMAFLLIFRSGMITLAGLLVARQIMPALIV